MPNDESGGGKSAASARPLCKCHGEVMDKTQSGRECAVKRRTRQRERLREKQASDPAWVDKKRTRQREWTRGKRASDPEWAERKRARRREKYAVDPMVRLRCAQEHTLWKARKALESARQQAEEAYL